MNYGGFLGSFGGAFGAQQQAMKNQRDLSWNSLASQLLVTTATTSNATFTINDYNGMATSVAGKPKPKPDTNLAWLNRRIDEIRVAL